MAIPYDPLVHADRLKTQKLLMKNKLQTFLIGCKQILGVGIYLLLIGILLEILMMGVHEYVSLPISIPFAWQVTSSVICVVLCFSGIIWFNKTLDLAKIYLAGGENKLMTSGPFNYVRHPLYATLMLTLPPLFIIWWQDLLFIVPWILIFLIAKHLVKIEEDALVRIFGEAYQRYREFVPDLIPYKGAGGKKFRKNHKKTDQPR
jgi:protein-S-isoprenylcysteine O-methyltransferase Ste14